MIQNNTHHHTPCSIRKDIIHCGEYIVDLSGWWEGEGEVIIYKRDRSTTCDNTIGKTVHTLPKKKSTLSC